MSLFQNSVLNKYLTETNQLEIKSGYEKLVAYFHNPVIQQNIRECKEEEYQDGFLTALFVNVFGYTLKPNPDFNLTREFKNEKGAKKADGAILKDGFAIGVIELKSTTTKDLESIRLQAFDYKANQQKCVYVITSNFEKVRFYINNAVEFEEFDLFRLSFEQFKIMWLCLAKENLLNGIPLAIKEDSVIKEKDITKNIYLDYSAFKKRLYNDLIENNLDLEIFKGKDEKEIKLHLFKKSQKLIDRFLFIFFGEDRGLLPPNSISEIIKQWENQSDWGDDVHLYDRYRKYFHLLNIGWKGKHHEIFAYNGGLFAPDEVLDSVKISDEVLKKHTKVLTTYDFKTEVDVNILGHIFENSLNEIEEVAAQIEGAEIDLKKSKRKKDGIFYTPKYITKYIVENTVGKLCKEKKTELGILDFDYDRDFKLKTWRIIESVTEVKVKNKIRQVIEKRKTNISVEGTKQLEILNNYRDWLLKLTICDPACGSGAFLNQALDFLITEHNTVTELTQKITGDVSTMFIDIENQILEHNIYGVDINEESIEIAKLSLWLRTAQKGRKLTTLSNNIKIGNSLIDDSAVAGEKAFHWQTEFPEVFANGGFDVVIGNPPYVRAELLGDLKGYLENNYSVYNPAGDLFSYFYEKSFILLKAKGLFGFISNTFNKTTAGISVREFLQNEVRFLKYIDFTEVQIFEGATTYPVIFIAINQKELSQPFSYIKIPKSSQSNIIDIDFHDSVFVSQNSLNKENWSFKSNQGVFLIEKLQKNRNIREIYGKCYYGVKTSLNEAFIIPKTYQVGKHIKPIFEGKELEKWSTSESIQQLILFESKWTKEKYGATITETFALERVKNEFPELMSHILPFEERARKRFDQGDFFWELRNCAYYDLFEKPKIVFPNLQNTNKFAFDETGAYIIAPAVILPTNDIFITAILNSRLVWYFLINICVVRNGGYIEVKPQYFEQIPIPEISKELKLELQSFTKQIISKTAEKQKIQSQFLRLMESKFHVLIFNKKLQNWPELDFKSFLAELQKTKIKLTLSEESEWMQYFNEQKQKAHSLKAEIDKTDREIDRMVYELYGLTEEEIKIVEESI